MLQKRAIFINTTSQIVVRFITLAFTLISVKLLTNYLGPSGVGNYNTITTYINFFIVIADLGLFSVTVREVSKDPKNEKKILSNVLTIRIVTALIASIIAAAIVFFTNYTHDIKLGVLIGTGFLFFNLVSSVYDVVFQYRLKMQYSAIAEFLSKLVSLAALYTIIKLHGNFLWIISTVAITGVVYFLIKWFFSNKFTRFGPKYNKEISGWIFQMAWPLGLVFIVTNLFFKLDTLMLYIIKGSVAVGIYSVAYKILEVSVFIASYFANSLKPTISREIDKSKEALASVIQKSILVMILLAMPISVCCIIYSQDIILFLSNSEFLSGSKALILLSLALPLIYLDLLLGEILVAKDSRKLLMQISIFILLFNLGTNLFFIPRYSFMGAAFTTLLSELVLLFINLHYTKKIIPYKVESTKIYKLFLLFVLTIVCGIFVKSLDFYFLIGMALTVIVFAIIAQMLGVLSYRSAQKMFERQS